MKKLIFSLILLSFSAGLFAAVPVGTNISRYPNTNVAPAMGMLLVAVTNDPGAFPRTNYNVTVSDFALQLTNGLSTISYVLTASNNLFTTTTVVSNGVITQIITASNNLVTIINNSSNFLFSSLTPNLWTNSQGIVRLTTNGPVSIASTGLLGNLVVTQDMRILGHNSASNSIWACTNATTGEGEWRTVPSLVATIGLTSDATRLVLQSEPIQGSLYYVGTNGMPVTNGARAGLEVSMPLLALRFGQVGTGSTVSNRWDSTNTGLGSVNLGSNGMVRGFWSSILGGRGNVIQTNSQCSSIVGGSNNTIAVNSSFSYIGGGDVNDIFNEARQAFIGGGFDNSVLSNTTFAVVVGGQQNTAGTNHCFVGGGAGNIARGQFSVVTGGDNSTAFEDYTIIIGGRLNTARGQFSVISGGSNNVIFGSGGLHNVISGGQGHQLGIGATFHTLYSTIGGGLLNTIQNDCDYSWIGGGRNNQVTGSGGTNCVIAGGANNFIGNGSPRKFAAILGGERNMVDGDYSFSIGSSNNVLAAARAGAIGMNVTNTVAGSVIAAEFRQYNTPVTISGTGNGNTNYTLNVNTPEMILGSSNVNILASMSWIDGKTHKTSLSITNDSVDNWGLSFSQVSNRVFWSGVHGTNVPTLTNNTRLVLNLKQTGSNIWVTYDSFRPAK